MTDRDENAVAEAVILENVRLGLMEFASVGEDGAMRYRLTPAGVARIERLLHRDDS